MHFKFTSDNGLEPLQRNPQNLYFNFREEP